MCYGVRFAKSHPLKCILKPIPESVVVYPPNGLQLEACRGFTFLPFVSRKFVPNVFIKDVIINEGLHRWSVRYYLALMVNPGDRHELLVAFEVRGCTVFVHTVTDFKAVRRRYLIFLSYWKFTKALTSVSDLVMCLLIFINEELQHTLLVDRHAR